MQNFMEMNESNVCPFTGSFLSFFFGYLNKLAVTEMHTFTA